MRPKGPFAMSDADLAKIRGFGKDAAAAKAEAKKLLADAGVPNLSFKFLNRNITTPYEPVAVFLIDQWKQVGITATHDVKETSPYQADLRAGNFQVALDFNCDFLDEPDLQLARSAHAKQPSAAKAARVPTVRRYVVGRLLLMIPTLVGVAVLTFVVMRLVPGDIVALRYAGSSVPQDVIDRERVLLGLDKPMWSQFVDWMGQLARFDFGTSLWTGHAVIDEVWTRLPL